MPVVALYHSKQLKACHGVYLNNIRVLAVIAIITACCITACKNGKAKTVLADTLPPIQRHIADSLQMAHNIDSTDYNVLFKNKTNIWLYKMLLNKQNKWANFTLVDYYKENKAVVADTPSSKFLNDYGMFLRWSPDSSYIIDIGSYGVEMARDKAGKLFIQSSDVDQEIRLHYNKAKTSKRLLFFGPSASAFDAKWVDSSQVALLSIFDTTQHRHPDTLLWIIDVKDNFFRKYKYRG